MAANSIPLGMLWREIKDGVEKGDAAENNDLIGENLKNARKPVLKLSQKLKIWGTY